MFISRTEMQVRIAAEIASGHVVVSDGVCEDCGKPDTTYGPGQIVLDAIPGDLASKGTVNVCYDCIIYRGAYTAGTIDGMEYMRASLANSALLN